MAPASASAFSPAAASTALPPLEPLSSLLFLGEEFFFTLFLLPAKLFFGLDATSFRLLQVLVIDPLGMSAMLAGDNVVPVWWAGATVRTETGKIETTDGGVFDVSKTAVGT